MSDTKQKTRPEVGNKTRVAMKQARLSLQKAAASQEQLRAAKAKLKAAKKAVKHAKKGAKLAAKAAAEAQQTLRGLLQKTEAKKIKGAPPKKAARRAAIPGKAQA